MAAPRLPDSLSLPAVPTNLTRLTIVFLSAGVLAIACGSASPNRGGAATTSAATTPSSSSGQVSEDLTFTGAITGHMGSAHRGDTYVCASTGGSYVAGPIVGDVAGKQMTMNVTKVSFRGAGTYPAGGVGFDVGPDHYFPATGSQSSLVVNADLRSGTVTIDLAANSDPNSVVGHVSGTWRCPPDPF
jgi:hypothetical protein